MHGQSNEILIVAKTNTLQCFEFKRHFSHFLLFLGNHMMVLKVAKRKWTTRTTTA